MSLCNLFKFRVFQLAIRQMPITRQMSTALHFRSAHLPSLTHTSIFPALFCNINLVPNASPSLLSTGRQVRRFSEEVEDPPPTLEEVKKTILDILAAFDKIGPEDVSLEAHFINDLALDSLDIVEIVMAFEDAFDLEINDDELETIFSGQDAVDLLSRRLEIPYPETTL